MLVFQRVGTIIDSAYSDVHIYIYILYTSLSYVCMYNMNIYIHPYGSKYFHRKYEWGMVYGVFYTFEKKCLDP